MLVGNGSNDHVAGAVYLTDVDSSATETLEEFHTASTVLATRISEKASQSHFGQLNAAILNSITDPLVILDADKKVDLLNPAAEDLLNTANREVVGVPLHEVLAADDLHDLLEQDHATQKEWISDDGKTFIPRVDPHRGWKRQS